MALCTVCSIVYVPVGAWRFDTCTECHRLNFAESQELRLHEEPDPSVQALTPRQHQAMRRAAERWAQEDAP